jgi:hypothetical protein
VGRIKNAIQKPTIRKINETWESKLGRCRITYSEWYRLFFLMRTDKNRAFEKYIVSFLEGIKRFNDRKLRGETKKREARDLVVKRCRDPIKNAKHDKITTDCRILLSLACLIRANKKLKKGMIREQK